MTTTIRGLLTGILAALSLAVGYLLTAGGAAASPVPPNDPVGYQLPIAPPVSNPTTTIVNTGSPWWTFVLVAAAAVACTVLVTSLLLHIRHAHAVQAVAH